MELKQAKEELDRLAKYMHTNYPVAGLYGVWIMNAKQMIFFSEN